MAVPDIKPVGPEINGSSLESSLQKVAGISATPSADKQEENRFKAVSNTYLQWKYIPWVIISVLGIIIFWQLERKTKWNCCCFCCDYFRKK